MAASVLVVDNDAVVLDVVKAILDRSSFRVLTAHNGAAALDALQSNPQVELVLSEALLPGLSGTELVRKVRKSYPAKAVMIMTAYTEERLDPGIPLLEKPFTNHALIDAVKAALERCQQARQRLALAVSHLDEAIDRSRDLRRRLSPEPPKRD